MIRTALALALALLASPALAARPPEALPNWLVATICTAAGDCHLRYIPIYDAPAAGCFYSAQNELAALLRDGETVDGWTCE